MQHAGGPAPAGMIVTVAYDTTIPSHFRSRLRRKPAAPWGPRLLRPDADLYSRVRMMAVVSDYSCDFAPFNYFSNRIAKLQIELQCFKSNLYISNRIARLVQLAI